MQNASIDFEKLNEMKKKYKEAEMSKEQGMGLKTKIQEAKLEKRRRKRKKTLRNLTAAAAAAAIFVLLPNTSQSVAHAMSRIPLIGGLVEVVTFRDYQYESDRHIADITVPEIVPGQTPTSTAGDTAAAEQSQVQEKLAKTAEEINAEIQEITDGLIKEFEESLATEWGYQDVVIDSKVVATAGDYFTLKLLLYQGAGSGMQWNYYYTIDLATGERLQLKDLFVEGADYLTVISDSIKLQMKAQMEADENVYYWLADENEDINFQSITDETSFYVNAAGNIVISFNEGDVAPMYMGIVEFEIPAEALSGIRK